MKSIPKIGELWIIKTPSMLENDSRTFQSKVIDFDGKDRWQVERFPALWFGVDWFLSCCDAHN